MQYYVRMYVGIDKTKIVPLKQMEQNTHHTHIVFFHLSIASLVKFCQQNSSNTSVHSHFSLY